MFKTFSFEATGTLWKVSIPSDVSADKALEKVKTRIVLFEDCYSRFKPTSQLNTWSKVSGIYVLPDDAGPLFDIYHKLEQLTQGASTPVIGQTLEEAGYDRTYSFKPKQPTKLLRWPDYLIYAFPKLQVKTPVQMDFGAAGKGYLMDLIADVLDAENISEFVIDAGQDILCKTSSVPLKIGLEHPDDSSSAIGIIELQNGSLCASSGNRRNWGNYSHIINGITAQSPKNILATWVIAKSGLLADALSTALFLTEPAILAEEFTFDYLILYSDFSIARSSGFGAELFTN